MSHAVEVEACFQKLARPPNAPCSETFSRLISR